ARPAPTTSMCSAGQADVRVAAVIPAHNEEETVADVVNAAAVARLVDEVVVVDNASEDGTADAASRAAAQVVTEPSPGKGEARRTGVAATSADIVVFLDADLVGLTPDHVDALVGPILDGAAAMTCGLFDRGPILNRLFLDALPIL